LFEEDTFLFGEEYSLCCTIKEKGYKVFILPSAKMHHHVSVTFKYNARSLAVARKLFLAVSWRLRKRHYGLLVATLNLLLHLLDALLLWMALTIKDLLGKEQNQRRRLMRTHYGALVIASLALLVWGNKYWVAVNSAAQRFFNGDTDPVRPPVTRVDRQEGPWPVNEN